MKRLYSLNSLSVASGIGRGTLKMWRSNGWLVPACTTGVQERYSEIEFEAAKRRSLENANSAQHNSQLKGDVATRWAAIGKNLFGKGTP